MEPMNNRKKVLVIQRIAQPALDLFSARDDIEVEVLTDTSATNIAAHVGDADAITIRDAPLPAEALTGAHKLKIISRHGVGYDNLPLAFCTERSILVTIIGDVNAVAVAEHTLYLMLAVAKNGIRFDRAVRAGDFGIRGRKSTFELRGKTLLLVGYGRIGQEFAARARALGMSVAAYDPFVDRARFPDVRFFDTLHEALAEADVVSLHVPLGDKTRNLIDVLALARMKDNSILINAARGGLIDEAALVSALEAGRLHGAGLDVFAREPPAADDPLLGREDIVLSPHCAALTADCLVDMGKATVRNVLAAFDGTLDPRLIVNRSLLK
ncbi:hydroxyacid dehydrogenase [Lichenihabitans psoromatis]|uniref:hydroxyacid dehydrogenase n=1 Tax=Lichenihabitans psoromatis TaxID=2528642 RepID=UPI001035CCAD|nr:hydroxyacid dehydrogenase [Lichenihabitans psoromatis]